MRRLLLTLQYDGSGFAGFQRQKNADRTVQSVLEQTLTYVLHEDIVIHGAGRTDRGVHALAQCAHFDTACRISTDQLTYALSRTLPADVCIRTVQEVPMDFHARKSAIGKAYYYYLYNGRPAPAIGHQYFSYEPMPIDRDLLQQVLHPLLGHHDFSGFCGRGATVQTYDRTLYLAKVESQGDWIGCCFIGDGFLRKMVRNIVGSAIDIATARKAPDIIEKALASGDRQQAGATAPANGLYMHSVFYQRQDLQDAIARTQSKSLFPLSWMNII